MNRAEIVVRNYRTFTDERPLRIEIAPCATAFVGKNNVGKSSALRFFFEFRHLWNALRNPGTYPGVGKAGNGFNIQYQGIADVEELFSNTNRRQLTIEVTFKSDPVPSGRHIARVCITIDRAFPATARVRIWDDPNNLTDAGHVDLPGHQAFGLEKNRYLANPTRPKIDLADAPRIFGILADALYIGAFRNAINVGEAQYFDIDIGTKFIQTWNAWKNGTSKAKSVAIGEVTEDVRRVFEFRSLEINPVVGNETLNVFIDGRPYRLNELGAGLAQFIIVFGNVAIRNPSLVLIDEPEINLHPSMQLDFLTALASYSTFGVMFATHSIGLARSAAEQVFSFQKDELGTVVRPFEATPNYAEFVGELSFSTFKEMGFDQILLVEGATDVKTAQQFLRKLGKDHRVVIVPLGGSQMIRGAIEPELYELTRLSRNIFALVDSERAAAGAPLDDNHLGFEAACNKLGIKICITERRAIENYLSDRAIKAELGNQYRALQPFELLRECAPSWAKASSWRIARRMDFAELADTDLGQFLEAI